MYVLLNISTKSFVVVQERSHFKFKYSVTFRIFELSTRGMYSAKQITCR